MRSWWRPFVLGGPRRSGTATGSDHGSSQGRSGQVPQPEAPLARVGQGRPWLKLKVAALKLFGIGRLGLVGC